MWGARHRKMGETKKKIWVRSREKNGRGKTATHRTLRKTNREKTTSEMEGQLAVHLSGTDPEEPAKLPHREIFNMNKKKENI